MSRKEFDDRLWELQDDLLTMEQMEDSEEIPDDEEDWDESDGLPEEETEEEIYEDIPVQNRDLKTYSRKNGVKEFSFYDGEEDLDYEEDVDYVPDNRREGRKRRRKNFFLLLLMVLEIFTIGFIVLRFALWLG